MSQRYSGFDRDPLGFYVEPVWAVRALFAAIAFAGGLHDPAAGVGTIVDAAIGLGMTCTGADIDDRANGRFPTRDFLADTALHFNIVCNPPYNPPQQRGLAARFVAHALNHVRTDGQVAMLLPLGFLASEGRHELLMRHLTRAIVLSKRPSMPPGATLLEFGEAARGDGSTDYAWLIFARKVTSSARITVAMPDPAWLPHVDPIARKAALTAMRERRATQTTGPARA